MVVALAVAVSALEAVGTVLVLGLLRLLTEGPEKAELPIFGSVQGLAPGLQPSELALVMSALVGLFFLVRSGAILTQAYVQYRVAHRVGARLSTRLLAGYLDMPYEFHLQRNSSQMVRNAFENAQRFVADGLVPGVRMLAKTAIIAGILSVLLASNPLETILAVFILGPLLWLSLHLVQPRVKRLGRIDQQMAKQTLQSLQQCLHGWRDIVLLGREQYFVRAFSRDRHRLSRARYLRRTAGEIPRIAIETGIVLFIVSSVAFFVVTDGGAARAAPVLGLFGYAAVRLIPELSQVTKAANSLKFIGPGIDNMYEELRAFEREGRDGGTSAIPIGLRDEVTLKSVRFRYPGADHDALCDVELSIAAGESIGIVGPTGGGKSTLVDVIVGLLPPDEGTVCVDGMDIQTGLRGWYESIGMVPQMVFLADDTLRRNIALGLHDEEIDEGSIWDSVRMAQLEQFVWSLPNGLDTEVGERGVRISGGQRQRLAIARALYRKPDLLVLDEGTSALDNETEAAFVGALEGLRGNRTIITVAHRLSTVASCDRVLLVWGGRIVDSGPYEELRMRHESLSMPNVSG